LTIRTWGMKHSVYFNFGFWLGRVNSEVKTKPDTGCMCESDLDLNIVNLLEYPSSINATGNSQL
jgi:hypothetical protein